MRRKVLGLLHAKLFHQLLLLGGSRFSRGETLVQNWWRLGCNGLPLVQFLSEDVGFVRKQDLRSFDLAKVEQHFWHLFYRPAKLIAIGVLGQKIAEGLRLVDDSSEQLFFLWLKWQVLYLILPALEIF